jgi:hypothetical protein
MTHPIIERAREILDRTKNVEWEYGVENSQRDPYAQEAQEADAFLARCAARRQSEPQPQQELVFKTFHNDTPAQQQSGTMDAQTQALWDHWVKSHIANALREFMVGDLGDLLVEVIVELRADMHEHVEKKIGERLKAGNVELIRKGQRDVA